MKCKRDHILNGQVLGRDANDCSRALSDVPGEFQHAGLGARSVPTEGFYDNYVVIPLQNSVR